MKHSAITAIILIWLAISLPILGGCQWQSSPSGFSFTLGGDALSQRCQTQPSPSDIAAQPVGPLGPGEEMIQTDLYFGLSTKSGGTVTPRQWNNFLDQVVTPRFPDGLTVLDAQGQWRDSSGKIVEEGTKVVIIIHPATQAADKAIEEIRELYKKQADQESVLRSSHPAHVSF